MLDTLLDFEEIMLQPAELNTGYSQNQSFSVVNEEDKSQSLPIFASPMSAITNGSNHITWSSNGIRPILPRTENIKDRLVGCQYIFTAFSLSEVREYFIDHGKYQSGNLIRVCIDCGNGHDVEIFNVSQRLKQLYNNQIVIMAGNIGNPKTYTDYCKAGIDYVRAGFTSGSMVDTDKYGFHIPLAQLLLDIKATKATTCGGFKHTKIIADGGIYDQTVILKAIALGADYVMIGRQFAMLLEAAGQLCIEEKNEVGQKVYEPVSPDIAAKQTLTEIRELNLRRMYCGNTTLETQALRNGYSDVHDWLNSQGARPKKFTDSGTEWVKVNSNLGKWLSDFYDIASYGFTMAGARNWDEFKKNIRFGRVVSHG